MDTAIQFAIITVIFAAIMWWLDKRSKAPIVEKLDIIEGNTNSKLDRTLDRIEALEGEIKALNKAALDKAERIVG